MIWNSRRRSRRSGPNAKAVTRKVSFNASATYGRPEPGCKRGPRQRQTICVAKQRSWITTAYMKITSSERSEQMMLPDTLRRIVCPLRNGSVFEHFTYFRIFVPVNSYVVYRQMDTCVKFGALCCELTRLKETKEACAKCGPKEDMVVTLKVEYFSNARKHCNSNWESFALCQV